MLNRTTIGWSCAILLLAAVVRLATLGAYPLMDNTEGRYSAIAYQMYATGDWVTPQMETGNTFLGKPPLSFWLSALSIKIFGANEFGARFSSFLLAALTVWMTIILGTKLRNRRFGLMCGMILTTSALFFVSAGAVMTDPSLCAALALVMISIPMSFTATRPLVARLWGYAFFIGLGLALLAKGPVGLVLSGVALFVWVAWTRQIKPMLNLPWISGGILMLLISVPWHLYAELANPGFLHYYFVEEHWIRFLRPAAKNLYGKNHDEIRGTIWVFLLLSGLPWLPVLGAYVWKTRKEVLTRARKPDLWTAYLVCWLLAPALFFSLSRNIMITYVLPSMSAMAILTALALERAALLDTMNFKSWFNRPLVFKLTSSAVPVIFLLICLFVLPSASPTESQKYIVQQFDKLDVQDDDTLYYYEDMPDSAVFYSKGNSLDLEDISTSETHQIVKEEAEFYLAITQSDSDELTSESEAEFGAAFEMVSKIDEYEIWRKTSKKPVVK